MAPPDNNAPEEGVKASDVCLHGLNLIMPLMSAELLKFPSLSLQYFKTITLVCELYPDKICYLNPDLQKNLMASLELGLSGIGVDSVYTLSCDFIQVLCSYIHRTKKRDVPIFEALRPFLKVNSQFNPRFTFFDNSQFEAQFFSKFAFFKISISRKFTI